MSAGNMPYYLISLLHAAGANKYVSWLDHRDLVIVGSLLEGCVIDHSRATLYPSGRTGRQRVITPWFSCSRWASASSSRDGIGFFVSCSIMNASVEDTSRLSCPTCCAAGRHPHAGLRALVFDGVAEPARTVTAKRINLGNTAAQRRRRPR